MSELKDKVVVVTGGTGALGQKVVEKLLESGAQVHIPAFEADAPSIDWSRPDAVKITANIDLSSEEAVTNYYAPIENLWASVHIAGGFAMSPIEETSLADFEKMWQRNTVTAFLCSREATRAIRKGQKGGRIANVAARPVLEPTGGMLAYTVSKAAVAALTEGLARELAGERIWVNAVAPAVIDTDANRRAMPDADFDSWVKPSAIAQTLAFLISPDNQTSSGCILPVYGAML